MTRFFTSSTNGCGQRFGPYTTWPITARCRSETPHTSLRWIVWRRRAGHAGGCDDEPISDRLRLPSARAKRSIWHTVSPRGTTRWSCIDAAPETPPARRVTLIARTSRPNRSGWRPSRCTANGRRSSRFSGPMGGGSSHQREVQPRRTSRVIRAPGDPVRCAS